MNRVGFGTRVLNCIIDTLIVFGITYGVYQWWIFHVKYWGYTYIPFYYFFFGLIVIYYTFFESIFSRSPAKWLTISKVVNKQKEKPNFFQIFFRNIIRITIIDCFFFPFLDKPLHDYLSKTEVVEA